MVPEFNRLVWNQESFMQNTEKEFMKCKCKKCKKLVILCGIFLGKYFKKFLI